MPIGHGQEKVMSTENRIRLPGSNFVFPKSKTQPANYEGQIKSGKDSFKSLQDHQCNKKGTKLQKSPKVSNKVNKIQSLKQTVKNTSLSLQKSNQSVKNLTKIAKNSSESFGKDRFGYKQNYVNNNMKGVTLVNDTSEHKDIAKVEKMIGSVDDLNTSVSKIKDLVEKTYNTPTETYSGSDTISSTDSGQESDNCTQEPMAMSTDTDHEEKQESSKLPFSPSKTSNLPKNKPCAVTTQTKPRFQSRLTKASPPSPKLKPKPKFVIGPRPYRPLMTQVSTPIVTHTLVGLPRKSGPIPSQALSNCIPQTTQAASNYQLSPKRLNSSHLSLSSCQIPGIKSSFSSHTNILRAPQSSYQPYFSLSSNKTKNEALKASFLTNTNSLNSATLHKTPSSISHGNIADPDTTSKQENSLKNKIQKTESSTNQPVKVKDATFRSFSAIKSSQSKLSNVPINSSSLSFTQTTEEKKSERSWRKKFNANSTLTKAVTERDASPNNIECLEKLNIRSIQTSIQQHTTSGQRISSHKGRVRLKSWTSDSPDILEDASKEDEKPEHGLQPEKDDYNNCKNRLDDTEAADSLGPLPPHHKNSLESKNEHSAKISSSKSDGKIQKKCELTKENLSSTNKFRDSHDNRSIIETSPEEVSDMLSSRKFSTGLVKKRTKTFQELMDCQLSQEEKMSDIDFSKIYKPIVDWSESTKNQNSNKTQARKDLEESMEKYTLDKTSNHSKTTSLQKNRTRSKSENTPRFKMDSRIFDSQKKHSSCLVSPIYSDGKSLEYDVQNASLVSPTYTFTPISHINSKNKNNGEQPKYQNEFDNKEKEINYQKVKKNQNTRESLDSKKKSISLKNNIDYDNEKRSDEKFHYIEEKEKSDDEKQITETTTETLIQERHAWFRKLDGENTKNSLSMNMPFKKETSPSMNIYNLDSNQVSNKPTKELSPQPGLFMKESSPRSMLFSKEFSPLSDVSSSSEFYLTSKSSSGTSISATPSLPDTPSIQDIKHVTKHSTTQQQSKDQESGATLACMSSSSSGHFTNSLSHSEMLHSKTTSSGASPNSLSEHENKDFLIDDEYTDQPELTFYGHEDDIEESIFESVDSFLLSKREEEKEEKAENSILLERIDSGHGGDSGILARTSQSDMDKKDEKQIKKWEDETNTEIDAGQDCKSLKRPTTFSPIHLHRIDELRAEEWSLGNVPPENNIEQEYKSERKRTMSGVSLDTLSGQESIASDDLMVDYEERNSEDDEKLEKNIPSQTKYNNSSNMVGKSNGNSGEIECPLSRVPSISETDGISLDWSTFDHVSQDVLMMKTNLLTLKRLLQEAEAGNSQEPELKPESLYANLVNAESPQLTLAANAAGHPQPQESCGQSTATALEENQDLKRQLIFLQQQMEDKDRRIRNLEALLSIRGSDTPVSVHSTPITPSMATINTATQTERIRPVSCGANISNAMSTCDQGAFISFRIGKFNQ